MVQCKAKVFYYISDAYEAYDIDSIDDIAFKNHFNCGLIEYLLFDLTEI